MLGKRVAFGQGRVVAAVVSGVGEYIFVGRWGVVAHNDARQGVLQWVTWLTSRLCWKCSYRQTGQWVVCVWYHVGVRHLYLVLAGAAVQLARALAEQNRW